MSLAQRFLATAVPTLGLMLGGLCVGQAVIATLEASNSSRQRPGQQKTQQQAITVGFLLGVPCTAGSLWMLGASRRYQKRMRSEQLQFLFYRAIAANDGKVSALQLAMLAQTSTEEAKDFLDAWASRLNADYDIDETGLTVYCFPLPE